MRAQRRAASAELERVREAALRVERVHPPHRRHLARHARGARSVPCHLTLYYIRSHHILITHHIILLVVIAVVLVVIILFYRLVHARRAAVEAFGVGIERLDQCGARQREAAIAAADAHALVAQRGTRHGPTTVDGE